MYISTVTQNGQATIPSDLRHLLSIKTGDKIKFEVGPNKEVIIKKVNPFDLEFTRALESSLSEEWNSQEDNEAYNDL